MALGTSTNIPVSYDFINLYNSSFSPSQIHTKNTNLFAYYGNYLLKKVISVFDFEGIPTTWAENYFKYTLFGRGFLAVFKHAKYGVIPQQCSLADTVSIFYQPKRVLIANPVLPEVQELRVGDNCELLKLQPDYRSVLDIVSLYADLLAIAYETASVNLINSKASFVFFAENKAQAETYKKMYDRLAAGEPMAVVDKTLKNEDGTSNYDFFIQNVGQNYIVDNILDNMKTIEDQFNTKVGIPNANTQKKERLISSEVEANDVDTVTLVNLWLTTMQNDLKKINEKYGLNISVSYRYGSYYSNEAQNDAEEVEIDG